jgi:hypothetical protein
MSKILRPNKNVQAFASDALSTERTVFDSSSQSDDIAANLNASFNRGWGVLNPVDFPTRQDFNALGYTTTQMASYLFQQGVPEWSPAQTYYTGSYIQYNGQLFQSVQDNNVGNDPANSVDLGFGFWKVAPGISLPITGAGPVPVDFVPMDDEYLVYVMQPDLFVLIRYNSATNTLEEVNTVPIDVAGPSGAITKVCRVSDRRLCVFNSDGLYMVDFDISGAFTRVGNIFPLTEIGDIDVASVSSQFFANQGNDHIVTYKDSVGSLEVYEFDGTDFVNLGVKYGAGLSGSISIAADGRGSDTVIMLSPNDNQISKLTYTASQIFGLDGLTPITSLSVSPNKLTSGFQNSVMSFNTINGNAISLDTAQSNVFEVGDVISVSVITSAAMIDKNVAVIYDDTQFEATLYLSQVEAGNLFWRKFGGSGIGFDPSGTAIKANNTQDAIKEVLKEKIYGVGKFFTNKNFIDPAIFLGFGTWVMQSGTFLIAVDESDADIDLGGKTGGAKTFNVEGHAITIDEMPIHDHDILLEWQDNNKASEGSSLAAQQDIDQGDFRGVDTRTTLSVGAGQEHTHEASNLPPFYAVYRWVRIA